MATPTDPGSEGVLSPSERDNDPRGDVVDDLTTTPSRPLSDEEEEAARNDPGRQERTYAPHSERVRKGPLPGDEKVIFGDSEPVETDEGQPPR